MLLTKTILIFILVIGFALFMTNDIGMRNMPPYLVDKVNNDRSKVVFVGGNNLDDLKKYVDSIEFN